ncbi:SpoIIE family protein phosphatase [Actinoplanes sp. TFC3]|uniref:SpoIIE family protein phosphatase n=1 Tax=Actinoplanes sp. TFC3 TaxID=1710355 RepID=UPI0009EA051D
MPDARSLTGSAVDLPAGAGLPLFADGVHDRFSNNGARLGEQRFVELAARLTTITSLGEYVGALLAEVRRGDDGRRSDDTAPLYLTWPSP